MLIFANKISIFLKIREKDNSLGTLLLQINKIRQFLNNLKITSDSIVMHISFENLKILWIAHKISIYL